MFKKLRTNPRTKRMIRNGSETTNRLKSIIEGVKDIEKQQREKNKVIFLKNN